MSWFEALCARDDDMQARYALDDQRPSARDRHHARLALEQMREALRAVDAIRAHPELSAAETNAWVHGHRYSDSFRRDVEAANKLRDAALALLDAPEPPREQEPQR